MSGNTQPFRKDIRVERSSLNVDPSPIFTKENETDSPDQFIKKMESTMSKKRKNNYKNIAELDNIYDTKNDKKPDTKSNTKYSNNEDSFDSLKPGEITETFDELGKTMGDMIKSLSEMSNGKKKGGKKNKKNKKTEEEEEDNIEGFSNNDNYKRIYKPEYEYGKRWKPIGKKAYAKMLQNAKAGLLNTTQLKDLLNTGQITQKQYNELFGFYLDFSGFSWKNINTTPPNNERCPKWNKNCGGDGPNIIDYLKQLISYFKQLIGIYSKFLRYISTLLYKSTDGKLDGRPSNNGADVSIIVNILHFLIMIPLSIYFAYNWFYITFYKDENEEPIKIDFSYKVMSSLKGLLIRFFKCLVQPMILLDAFMRLVIPKAYFAMGNTLKYLTLGPLNFSFIGKILTNPIFIFISLVLIILHMTCKYSDKLEKMLYSYMEDKKVPYESQLHGIIAYDWIIGIAAIGIIGRIFGLVETLMSPLSAVFWFLVLVIFSHLMIRFAGIFFVLYLYAMSYGALAIYSSGGMSAAMKSINLVLEASITQTDNKCPPGFWEKIVIKILELIYKYLFAILYLIVLAYSTYWIFTSMKSYSGKIILGSTLTMIIAGIIMAIALTAFMGGPSIKKSDIDI
jgi:hypothetical protein